jgi:hypothetical protein
MTAYPSTPVSSQIAPELLSWAEQAGSDETKTILARVSDAIDIEALASRVSELGVAIESKGPGMFVLRARAGALAALVQLVGIDWLSAPQRYSLRR